MIQDAYVQGVSTRSFDDLVNAMDGTSVSKSQASRLCAEIDDKVRAFLDRPLEDDWPYVWLGVWSRNEMARVDFEGGGVVRPGVADGLVGRPPFQRL